MKKRRKLFGFSYQKIWQILKHLSGTFFRAQTLKLWGVSAQRKYGIIVDMYEIVDLSKLNHKLVEGLGKMTYWHDGFRHGKFRETIFIFMHWRQNLRLLKGKNTPQQKYGINIETIYLTKYSTSTSTPLLHLSLSFWVMHTH